MRSLITSQTTGDDDRGWMYLEWDKEPEFFTWKDAPKYRTIALSKVIRCTPISF